MEAFFIHLLKSSGILLLFLGCYFIFLRKVTFFKSNRWFLLGGLLISLLIPFINITKTVFVEPTPLPSIPAYFTASDQPLQNTSVKMLNWILLGFGFYMLGVVILSFRLILQLYMLKRTKNQGVVVFQRDKLFYVETPKAASPFSFFNHIFYSPETFDRTELQTILAHEKIHAKELHSIDILITDLVAIMLWFNPLVWLYKRAIQQNLEFLADSQVSHLFDGKKSYQYLMLRQASKLPINAIYNSFYNSFTKKRITMLNTQRSNKNNLVKYSLVFPLLIGFMLLFNVKTVAKIKPKAIQDYGTEILDNSSRSKLYTITKNTSQKALDQLIKEVEKDGGELHIENIKRNDDGWIIGISIRYDVKDGGSTTGKSSDEKGISNVYFGISEGGGCFISFHKEAVPGLINGKPYYSPMKESEEQNSSFTRTRADGSSVTTDVTRVTKNGKETLYINGKESTDEELNRLGIYTDKPIQTANTLKVIGYANPSILFLNKNTTDTELKFLKQQIEENFGGTFTYSKLKRNNSGEITTVDISYKDETEGRASWTFDKNKPIPYVLFKKNKKNGLQMEIMTPPSETNPKAKIAGESGDVTISVYMPIDSIVPVVQGDVNASEHRQYEITTEKPQDLTIYNADEVTLDMELYKNYLYMLNGKPVTAKKVKKISPIAVDTMNIFKGEEAIKKYGKKALNGVIEITTKKNKQ
ncbi:M56 family metallopeptidase [Maribacter sp. 2304DJ31-5]|uniref:M56 family metallopeptidase n=1 Tax=Maribacter sp. 2304DJ31-5 TaxID=3386273 RepID=UPI0039BCEDEE